MPVFSNYSSKTGTPGLIGRWSSRLGISRKSSWPANMSWLKLPSLATDTSAEAVLTAYAGMEPDMVLDHLQTHKDGLTDDEADTRRSIKGPNILPTHAAPSWIITLLKAIPNPFNILLIILAIINAAIPPGDWVCVIELPCCPNEKLKTQLFVLTTLQFTERFHRPGCHGHHFRSGSVLARISKQRRSLQTSVVGYVQPRCSSAAQR